MLAAGVNGLGRPVTNRPQLFLPDGKEHPLPGVPCVAAVSARPKPNTIQAEGRQEGRILGQATHAVSAGGQSLTATASGMDREQSPFRARCGIVDKRLSRSK